MTELGKMLMMLGGLLILVGAFLAIGGKLPWFGRLPGDIMIQRDNFTFYFPLATSLVISVLLSLLFLLFRR
jgi:membrane protein implicated in regulation of membrane protease activity